jgi:cystathionine beta-lyase
VEYDFDEIINRRGTNAVKWEAADLLRKFGLTDRFDSDTIPLFIADMDFQCPEPVLEALHTRVDQGMFGYTTHLTSPNYIEAIQGWFERRHDWKIKGESIVYTPGTVEGLDALIRAFSKEGEGVIVQRPVYTPFMSTIERNGRKVVSNSLVENDQYYTIDFDDLEEKAKDPKNTLFLLCSPHNPVGRVWRPDELIKMAEICIANDVVLVSDEIHGDLIRTDQTHYPICGLVDDDRLISCTSINKTFNTAGLHCSNIVIENREWRERFVLLLGMKMPSPFAITALIASYNHGEPWLGEVNNYIDANLEYLDVFFREKMPEVKYRIPEGTYIAWVDFRGYGLSSDEVHERIYHRANVVLQDGEFFGDEGAGFQRICVPSPRGLLKEAMERIASEF